MSDLTLLRTFLSAYRTGSFTAAAEDLHLTQPAVSQHVRSLEQRLNRSLFERKPRGAEPTPAAHELAGIVARHLDALQTAIVTQSPSPEAEHRSVFLGGPSSFISTRVLPALEQQLVGSLRLRLFLSHDGPVLERLHNRQLDLAITTSEWRARGYETERLCVEELVLVAGPSWADFTSRIVDGPEGAAILDGLPLLAYDEDLPLIDDYWRLVFDRPAPAPATVVANSISALLALATLGAGITVLPRHACAQSLASGELVALFEPPVPPRNQLYLTWPSGAPATGAVTVVRDHIREVLRSTSD